MDFVRGVGVPDNQLAVLRGGHQVSPVSRPMHSVDFGQMAFECSLGLHGEPGELFCALSRDITH